jgi:hypothetical protein
LWERMAHLCSSWSSGPFSNSINTFLWQEISMPYYF